MVALVDCNSFYASCEQVFRPDLQGKPVVVLSNNDGCIIAANREAKSLAHIPMFEPVFKIKDRLIKEGVVFFSSNYTLYDEMSRRVMNILKDFSAEVEVYSIDESFISLRGMDHYDLGTYAYQIKKTIFQYTGLPVGVGIGPGKVLAKLANRIAKKTTGQHEQVYIIDSETKRIKALKETAIKDIWGIGKKHCIRLNNVGVISAFDFTQLSLAWVRKNMTVVGERIWRELRGEACMPIITVPKSKKMIGTAKSFGRKLENLELIEEACAYYISEVAEILRKQKSCARYLQVFLQTNYHSKRDKQYHKTYTLPLSVATNNTLLLIREAKKILYGIYKPGYCYKKVGVMLSGIIPEGQVQTNLFESPDNFTPPALMKVLDEINLKYGKATLTSGLLGSKERQKEWELIKEERSPRYTTQWKELLKI